jgi:hypothetical protein
MPGAATLRAMRRAASRLACLPAWAVFVLGLAVLFLPFAPIGTPIDIPADHAKEAALRAAPLWLLAVVPLGEALLWTVAFTEAFARVFRAPVLGMACGLFAYGVLFHAPEGVIAIAASTWVGAVCGVVYLVLRRRSRLKGALAVAGLRWSFVAFAVYTVGAMGPSGPPFG